MAIVDLSEESGVDAASQISAETGGRVFSAAADASDPQACHTAYTNIVSELGSVGILINNAGIMPPRKGRIEEIPHEDFQRMMDIHLGGAVNWCRLVMSDMRAQSAILPALQ